MKEPNIQCQPNTPDCLVNSEWVKWAVKTGRSQQARIEELEEALEYLSDSAKYDVTVTRYARAALLQGENK
jgi:hypothetical protein